MFERTQEYFRQNAAELTERQGQVSRAEIHADLLSVLPQGKLLKVLDIGAGSGDTAALFEGLGHDVVASEPVASLVEIARKNFPNRRIDWREESLPSLPQTTARQEAFDAIIMKDVLHYLDMQRRGQSLRNIFSKMAVGGLLEVQFLLQVPNKYQEIQDGEIADLIGRLNAHPKRSERYEVVVDKTGHDLMQRTDKNGQPLDIRTIVIKRTL